MREIAEFRSDRTVQVWFYTVSQAQLLLRSNPTEEHPSRVEVLFKGVGYVEVPTTLHGLVLEICAPEGDPAPASAPRQGATGCVHPHGGPCRLHGGPGRPSCRGRA